MESELLVSKQGASTREEGQARACVHGRACIHVRARLCAVECACACPFVQVHGLIRWLGKPLSLSDTSMTDANTQAAKGIATSMLLKARTMPNITHRRALCVFARKRSRK